MTTFYIKIGHLKAYLKRIRIRKQSLEINFFLAIWAHLLFPNNAPSTYAKFMKSLKLIKEN